MISNKGQTVTPEFVVIFFLAIAAVVASTVYIQRGLQARVRDARLYMVDMATSGCQSALGADCEGLSTTTGKFKVEYETYYGQQQAEIGRTVADNKIFNTAAHAHETFQQTVTRSSSEQRAPWNG